MLKLNFDGSFSKETCQGGWGGLIRDSTSQILLQVSCPIECLDFNAAENLAMLMGCQELKQKGSYKTIIAGDSFLVIQWGVK